MSSAGNDRNRVPMQQGAFVPQKGKDGKMVQTPYMDRQAKPVAPGRYRKPKDKK